MHIFSGEETRNSSRTNPERIPNESRRIVATVVSQVTLPLPNNCNNCNNCYSCNSKVSL